jgi:hypothetical protein
MGEAEQDSLDNSPKPDRGLYIGILFGVVSILFFVLQSNGVEVNWLTSAAIYVFCVVAVVWTTLRHALPGRGFISYWVAAGLAILFLCLGSIGTYRQYRKEHPKESPMAVGKPTAIPYTSPVPPSPKRKTIKISKPLVRTPCTPSWAKREVDYADLPGGPNLQKPVLVINIGTMPIVITTVNGDTLILFDLVLTNRGEASIVKNWELCLIRDKKPVIYQATEIPREGITVDTETILPNMSLVDNAIKNPIEHAHTAGGWVAFKIPGTEFDINFATGKEPLSGGVQFRDYLDHPQYFGFVSGHVDIVEKLPHRDYYVPGSPH